MNLPDMFVGVLDNPYSPRYYRELIAYYTEKGMNNEAEAFKMLIRKKFDEKNGDSHNNAK
jgi:hypothetical protein